MSRTRLAALALALTSSAAAAQEVTFFGKVEDVSGTQNQFFLDCTDTGLTSGLFDLNLFIGQQVRITGDWNGSAADSNVVVTDLEVVPEVFEIGGGAKIGDTSTLSFTAAPGTPVIGFLSADSTFLPFGDAGVFLADPTQAILRRIGTVGGAGVIQMPFAIPNDPSFIGFELFGQGALIDGLTVTLTNPDCKTIDD